MASPARHGQSSSIPARSHGWLLNDYYELPFGCFVPERGEGLLAAGRCLSAEHEAVASARVTAQCFGYGHAAAIAVKDSVATRSISGEHLRDSSKSRRRRPRLVAASPTTSTTPTRSQSTRSGHGSRRTKVRSPPMTAGGKLMFMSAFEK